MGKADGKPLKRRKEERGFFSKNKRNSDYKGGRIKFPPLNGEKEQKTKKRVKEK